MTGLTLDLHGRINNTNLPKSKYLLALLEAVVNSIQSIEDSNISNGRVDIQAVRQDYPNMEFSIDKTQHFDTNVELTAFESFVIEDNGNGFTAENYKSFCTADSSLKWKKGCKGIGRFLWLKVFEEARIDSVFEENGELYRRVFCFDADGIEPDDNIGQSDIKERRTIITLCNFRKSFRDECPKGLEVLAQKIIEHCLIYFITEKCHLIILRDSLGESIELNSYYEQSIKDSLLRDNFTFEEKDFVLYHLRVPEGATSHELHLCANGRDVCPLKLDRFYPNLQKKIRDVTGKGFFYCGYITGEFLE